MFDASMFLASLAGLASAARCFIPKIMQRSRASSTSSVRIAHSQFTTTQQPTPIQPLEAPKIIIIHPGSQHLRIGRAADLNPLTILHAVAYKRTHIEGGWPYHDQLLPPLDNTNPTRLLQDFDDHRLDVSRVLQNCIVDEQNRLRVATPPQQLAIFNRSSVPEKVPPPLHVSAAEDNNWLDRNAKVIFDDQILRLTNFDARDYDIHFPIKRGQFNVHKEKGGSLQATLAHLECIWSYALEQRMKIPLRELGTHSAVLVINDVYMRRHLREAVSLLLRCLGFQRCFLVQDSVASTYGAGIGYGCVVDIGAQKTSIACIEDGVSQLDARVRMSYGGGDIAQVLLMLLRKCSFPYRECSVQDSYADAHLLDELKERFCHLQTNVCGSNEKQFTLRKPNGQWLRYTLQVGDEALMAPMAFFHTELLNITGKTRDICTQQSAQMQYDCEDCFDAEYLRETGRRNGARGCETPLTSNTTVAMRTPMYQPRVPITADVEDELIVVDQDDTTVSSNSNSVQPPRTGAPADSETWFNTNNGQILPLDAAIIRAISRCGTYETKRKMFGSILMVGSSVKVPGLAAWLEHRISQQVPGVEVNVFTKGMDAGMVAWKGAAIMSVLESARELWITRREWQRYGLRILRERSPFLW